MTKHAAQVLHLDENLAVLELGQVLRRKLKGVVAELVLRLVLDDPGLGGRG